VSDRSSPRRHGAHGLLAAGAVLISLAGCASPGVQPVANDGFGRIPQHVELDSVPFYAQDGYQCGPAALAMVLGAGGTPVDPGTLRPQVYVPGRHGSLQVEMLAAARRNGFVAVELEPRLAALLAEIAAGNPVVVLQNLGFDWIPLWHYAVAVGYDLDSGRIVLRSGSKQRLEMPLDTFERSWQRGGDWAMLALPPQRFPASVPARDYLGFVIKLEKAGQTGPARAAYESVLNRAPDNLVALLGLGNTAYAEGDFETAERAFRRAVVSHPQSAAAHNNLAQTLAELGRYEEALAEARAAVSLGGPLEDAATRTLHGVASRAGKPEQAWQR
jgi:tetratricopeptide (TPR) repeat protein